MTANDKELTIDQSVPKKVTCAQKFGDLGLISFPNMMSKGTS